MTLILIDCENFSHNCVEQLFADYEVGPNVHAHGFCDFSLSQSWTKELFLKFNITPHQVFHANRYKNAADMALARFAMERIYAGGYGELVIASSDSDFCDLMLFAKSQGLRVVCYASNALINPNLKLACSELIVCKAAAKTPAKTPTKAEKNAEKKTPPQSMIKTNAEQIIAAFKAEFGEGAQLGDFVAAMRARGLIGKNKRGEALKNELKSIGIFVSNQRVFSDRAAMGATGRAKSADKSGGGEVSAANDYAAKSSDGFFATAQNATGGAKSADKSAAAAAKQGASEAPAQPAAPVQAAVAAKQTAEQTAQPVALEAAKAPEQTAELPAEQTAEQAQLLELFYAEIFAHKCQLKDFAAVLENHGIAPDAHSPEAWLLERGFCLFGETNKWRIFPASAVQNGALSDEYKSRVAELLAAKKAELQAQSEQKFSAFIKQRAAEIAVKNAPKAGVFASVKRLFGFGGEDYESKVRRTLEAFWRLAKQQTCEIKPLAQQLADEQICAASECIAWLHDCGLAAKADGGEVRVSAQGVPRPFCHDFFQANLQCKVLPHGLGRQVLLGHFKRHGLRKVASATERAAAAELAEQAAKTAAAAQPAAKSAQPAAQSKPPQRKTQHSQMLQNFAPAACAIILRRLNATGTDAEAICAYFRSLNLAILRDFCVEDLAAMGLQVNEFGKVVVDAADIAAAEYFEHQNDIFARLKTIVNRYATTLCEHKGNFYQFTNLLKKEGLLPSNFTRAASCEYLRIFGLLSDEERGLICPAGSDLSEFEGKNLQPALVLKTYSQVLQNGAELDELQRAALQACWVGESSSVKADFLIENCLIKRFDPPKIRAKLYAGEAFLRLLKQFANTRSKNELEEALGADAMGILRAEKLINIENICGEEAVFLCCDYQADNALNSEVISEYFAGFYAHNKERANAYRAALCAAFDELASEHGGLLGIFLALKPVQAVLGTASARVKKLHLRALGFEIDEPNEQFVAKPGEEPTALAPSQEHLEQLAASAVAAAAGLFDAPAAVAAAHTGGAESGDKTATEVAEVAADCGAKKQEQSEPKAPANEVVNEAVNGLERAQTKPQAAESAEQKPAQKDAQKEGQKNEKKEQKPAQKAKSPAPKAAKKEQKEGQKEQKPAQKAEKKPAQPAAKKPSPAQIASNVARVQAIKHELGRADADALIAKLRELKIRPMDLGCPNWANAFKKYAIFED